MKLIIYTSLPKVKYKTLLFSTHPTRSRTKDFTPTSTILHITTYLYSSRIVLAHMHNLIVFTLSGNFCPLNFSLSRLSPSPSQLPYHVPSTWLIPGPSTDLTHYRHLLPNSPFDIVATCLWKATPLNIKITMWLALYNRLLTADDLNHLNTLPQLSHVPSARIQWRHPPISSSNIPTVAP